MNVQQLDLFAGEKQPLRKDPADASVRRRVMTIMVREDL